MESTAREEFSNLEVLQGPIIHSPRAFETVLTDGPSNPNNFDQFNLSPIIRQICGVPDGPRLGSGRRCRRYPRGDPQGPPTQRSASSRHYSSEKRLGPLGEGDDLVRFKSSCVLSSPSNDLFQSVVAAYGQPRRTP